jgi:hypothetical protein
MNPKAVPQAFRRCVRTIGDLGVRHHVLHQLPSASPRKSPESIREVARFESVHRSKLIDENVRHWHLPDYERPTSLFQTADGNGALGGLNGPAG